MATTSPISFVRSLAWHWVFREPCLPVTFDSVSSTRGTSHSRRRVAEHRYRVVALGETDEVVEEFYAISVERRLTAPAVLAMREAGKRGLFRQRNHRA